jgi:CBS domain-containing protein
MNRIEDIMTSAVVTVKKDTPLAEAAMLLSKKGFNGLPVVDGNGKLVGMFTERHLVSDKSYIHVKAVLQVLNEVKFYKQENSAIKEDIKHILNLKVQEVMDSNPTTIHEDETIERAAALFADQNNNPLPVVTPTNKLVGIIALSDLTKFYGIVAKRLINTKDVDMKLDQLVGKLGSEYTMVTKFRVSTWFVTSMIFTFVGFTIAMFLILRIT